MRSRVVCRAALLVSVLFEASRASDGPVCNSSSDNNDDGSCGLSAGPIKRDRNNGTQTRTRSIPQNLWYESIDVEWCRRRPTWRTGLGDESFSTQDIRGKCQNVLGYFPDPDTLTDGKVPPLSSTYDKSNRNDENYTEEWDRIESDEDDSTYYSLPVLERPLLRRMGKCIDLIRASIDDLPGSLRGKTTGTMNKPKISKLHRRTDGLAVMAVVEDALVEEEAEAVLALAHCLKKALPASFERRRFEFTEEGGGNDVTYLAGFLQLLAPGVAHRIQATAKLVWEAAAWKDDDGVFEPVDVPYREDEDEDEELDLDKSPPPPIESAYSTRWWPDPVSECGIRTTEHLSYDRWGGLGYHEDSGSDYTVLVALSDPKDYEGGAFNLCPEYDNDEISQEEDEGVMGGPNCKEKISVKPNRLSAIVFLSEFSHGVEDIKTPGRVTFANELWRYGDVPCMSQRPTPNSFVRGDDDDYDHDEDDYDYDHDEDEDDEGNLLYDGDFGIIEDEELEQAIE